jgi:hypothetical protein
MSHVRTDTIPVIFRVFPKKEGGDVVALFPTLPGTHEWWTCSSYMHVGQHGGADCRGLISMTRPATPDEYAALKRELESPPYEYRLKVVRRVSRAMIVARRRTYEKLSAS